MDTYIKKIEIRWADLDPNFHVLHSRYYDFGAYSRMSFLNENGITGALMNKHHIGPILLREECIFRKEIRFGEEISISLLLHKISRDLRRWTMYHELRKNGHQLAAQITIDGAWMDTSLRKMATPPEIFCECFDIMPKSPGFTFID